MPNKKLKVKLLRVFVILVLLIFTNFNWFYLFNDNYNSQSHSLDKISLRDNSSSSDYIQEWNTTWGGSYLDKGNRLAVDSLDNVYEVGVTDPDGSALYDIALVKYSKWGVQQWNRTWGGSEDDMAYGIVIDPSDNIYIAGYTKSYDDADGDMVILKYDNSGNYQWNKTWSGSEFDVAYDITIDSMNNFYVTGQTNSLGEINGDLVLIKFDSSWIELWNVTWGGDEPDRGFTIKIDSNDYVVVGGGSQSTDDMAGETDALIIKYDTSGNLEWQKSWGGLWSQGPVTGLAFDSSNNIYATGRTFGHPAASCKGYILKYDPSGTYQWYKVWGVDMNYGNRMHDIIIDSNDELFVSGTTYTHGIPDNGDVILFNYDTSGNLNWYKLWTGSEEERGLTLCFDSRYNIYIGGFTKTDSAGDSDFLLFRYSNTINLFKPTLSNEKISPNQGNQFTKFNFTVLYTDIDGYPPSYVHVVINETSYDMEKVILSDTNFTNGCLYQYTTHLIPSSYNYTYYFECSDGMYYNSSNIYNNLKVDVTNFSPPELINPQVLPILGSHMTLFNFTISYFDDDNNLPQIVNLVLNDSVYIMTPTNISDDNALNGIDFFFKTTLNVGQYKFKFNCTDGIYTNSTDWILGLEVNPFIDVDSIQLLNPSNSSNLFTDWVNFSWYSIDETFGNVNFTLQISNTSDFSNIIFEQLNIEEQEHITFTLINLNFIPDVYYWRVCPHFESFTGNWSEYFTFDLSVNYYPPTLDFSSVTPNQGDQFTLFNFTVIYFDQDNNAPQYLNTIINGVSFIMEKLNSLDTNYIDGCIFQYLTTLPFSIQNYTYAFNCSDGKYESSSPIFNNLEVNPANYFVPELLNPLVSPILGDNVTLFSFTIWYFDIDNNIPRYVNISLNSMEFSMIQSNPIDDNATDGILFYYSTYLEFGYYSYRVNCSDGKFEYSTNWILGPEVNPFYGVEPILLLNPTNNIQLTSNWINFTWNSLNLHYGPVNYTLQISNLNNFSSILYEISDIPELPKITYYYLNVNLPEGLYYWRVGPELETFRGNWSYYYIMNLYRNDIIPSLTSCTFYPFSGNQTTIFRFNVIYKDLDNNVPSFVRVIINGISYSMEKLNPDDSNYIDGCTYQFITLLQPSIEPYLYSFECSDGTFYNSTSDYEGPIVNDDSTSFDRTKGLNNLNLENIIGLSISLIIGIGIVFPSILLAEIKTKRIKSKTPEKRESMVKKYNKKK